MHYNARYPLQQYKHAYLGEVVGTGLNVFTNIESKTLLNKDINEFQRIFEGIDWGFAVDPFVFIKVSFDRKKRILYIFDEVYEIGLSNDEAIRRVEPKHNKSSVIVADNEEPKSIYEFQDAGLPVEKSRKGPGSVSFGIKKLRSLFKIVIDPERCPNACREFINYSYEQDRSGNVKSQYPDKDNHTIDAVRYALQDEFDY